MSAVITDYNLAERLIAQRRESGADRYDEVWDGVYVMAPMPNDEHQDLVHGFDLVLGLVIHLPGLGKVRPGVNVTDRDEDWEQNFRCPDVVVYLNETKAINRDTHWIGGPDFAVEIASRRDKTRDKLGFYAEVGTRELLPVDRDPWALELYRLDAAALKLVGKSTLDASDVIVSEVVPLSYQLVPGEKRPRIAVAHTDGKQKWTI
jgi:Uma2 family endonuclease